MNKSNINPFSFICRFGAEPTRPRLFPIGMCLVLLMSQFGQILVGQEAPRASQPAPNAPPSGNPPEAAQPTATPVTPPPPALVLENQDLRGVLQVMARQAGVSLIISDDIKGTVTARLSGLDPLEAIKVLLESKGFMLDKQPGNLYVARSATATAQEPVATEPYSFKYATAKESKPIADKLVTKNGHVDLDDRSNTLIITDTDVNRKKIMDILQRIDQPIKQVLIDTRLLETQHNPSQNLGIRWTDSFSATVTPGNGLITENEGGNGGIKYTMQRSAVSQSMGTPTPLSPLVGTTPALAVLTLPQLQATLHTLLQSTDTEVLGNPKILTVDNKEAVIKISTQQPIPQFAFNASTASFGISGFDFHDIGNVLTVTPHVNGDNIVTMDVKPEVSDSTANATFPVNGAGGAVSIPIINQRTLSTRVTLQSGNTLALGGLISENQTRAYNKVPFLGDIPLIGELFTNRNFNKTKRNLLIFITPTVISQTDLTGLEDQYAVNWQGPNAKLKELKEDDRFPYKKSFIGNGIPRDQFRTINKGQALQGNELSYDADQVPPEEVTPARAMDFDTQEKLVQAKLMLRETERLFSQGDYAGALNVAQEAEKKLKGIAGSAMDLSRARQYQAACLFRLAQVAFANKDYVQAFEMAKKSYVLDPKNREAFELQEKAAEAMGKTAEAPPPQDKSGEAIPPGNVTTEPSPEQPAPRLTPSLRE